MTAIDLQTAADKFAVIDTLHRFAAVLAGI
jgi:hypothetical protein